MEIRTLGLVCFILSLDLAFSQLACPTGKWGTNCDLTCHANCKLNCERAKGTCYGCKDGWYDSHCDTPCSDCKFGCDQKTGLCECDVYGCQTCKTDAPSECDVCDSTKNFIHNIYAPERCCSDGCGQQVGGVINCKANGTCDLDTCEVTGYWGEKCTKCSETIPHCESCNRPQGTSTLICTQCWSSYEISNDQKRCCPPGCDDCQTLDINDDGKETDVCSVCKSGYYIYGERCDNCGGNCQSPSAGPPEARCDPVDGHCLYGCLSGWHGSKCDVKCELSNCETCQYDEPNKSLTCLTCAEGWAPHPVTGLCEQCNSNCADGRCDQETGYCTLGCSAGWRGDRCDQPCADAGLGNCTVCGRDTMTCSECMFNNWGPICENECSPHCSPEKDLEILNPICVKDTAECRGGCYPGYWREDCRLECPNCLNDTCRITDGKCTENACKSGFWDDNCEAPCSPYCALNSATGEQECNFQSGFCTHGCTYNTHGDTCLQPCNPNCYDNRTDAAISANEPLCAQNNGQCMYECKKGFYTFDCSKPCESTCVTDDCGFVEGYCVACDWVPKGQACYDGDCQVGRQGLFCNETCPEHCESSCDRYNSTCDGCNPGFYNDTCDYVCGFCSDVTCNQATGRCDVGCVDGYWGDLCLNECLYPDCKSCSRDDGECDVCVPGKHGKDCSEDCSSACAASSDGKVYCQKDTGVCREGLCSPGWYSADCSLPCPDYCAPIENRGTYCAIDTGSCNDGCLPGWYGDLCDIPCNTNCRGGLCTRSGYCIDGCVENFYGDYCESECGETCNDNMCDRDSGRCEECYVIDRPPTFECRDAACPSGAMGLLCDEPCPPGCQDTCQRYNGTCASCKSGFYGDHCNITCGNCFQEACEQQTGNCYQGCLDEWYGLQCLQSCVDPNCQTCDIITGTCRECKPRHYGFTCAKNCSDFCAPNQGTNVVRCDMETGSCKAEKCQAGHYLKDCSRRCNDTCGADFNGDRPCDLLTGRCQYDCVPGWYGDTCDRRCSQQCAEGLCNRTGFCLGDLDRACQPGYYGGDCRLNCFEPQTCNDGRCHRFNGNCSACDDPPKAPECRDAECPKGTWGLNCDQTCPPNCEGGVCIREVGLCKDCLNTWYGDACDSQCRNCQDDVCFQSNGNCIRNCKDGWYTSTCNTPCLYPGCKDCTRDNGTCVDCQIGKYKDDCSADCSPNCAHTDKGLECIKSSGICRSGQCNTGYWHETCREECSPYCDTDGCELSSGACSPCKLGWFGISCRQKCSANCKNEHCEGTYDNCVEGCKDGFWGPTCDYQCNQNCVQDRCDINTGECSIGCNNDMFYGPTCKESCNLNCATETGTRGGKCERSGYCRTDCVNGTYGDMCENACPTLAACTDGTCHRKNGNCSACDAKEPSYLCPSADCKIGMWGINCEKNCSSTTCLYNRCTREDDICVGCPIGLYARKCDKTCGQCKIGTGCNQLSGVCEEGCRDGFQGDKCDQACASNCQSCERYGDPTKCVTCIENTWGPNCEFTCNPNCAKIIEGTRAVTRCEKDTGHCSSGTCREDRFWRYNCSEVCPQNCLPVDGVRTCKIHNGACEGGCQNTYFGTQCTQECSVQCKDKICLNSRNNCVNGCAQGYYSPPTCSGTCSAWCKNPGNVPGQEICDPNTGSCLYKCVDGYFGDRCIEKCYGVCTDGTCDDLGGCPDCRITPVGPKCHPQVCPISPTTGHGTYGPSCESDCPGLYCKNRTCHRQTGKCPQGCQEWFHGEYCTEKCICDRTGTQNCNQEGVCECNPGFTSVDCSQRCSDGCQSNLCDKTGQCTLGCIAGRYGAQCNGRCSNCVDESCNPSTGECSIGCKPGFFGTRCEDACADNCLTCQSDAACTSCVSFRYGLPTCTQTCSAMCKQAASGRVCSESSGACIEGCVNGFYGNQCDKRCDNCGGNAACSTDGECLDGCRPGYFGSKCDVDCSFGCARGGQYNSRECDITSGACTYGCLSGYHGSTCLMCSATCLGGKCSSATVCTDGCEAFYYGKDSGCSRECTNCKNGKCDDEGTCLEGCMDRFYGTRCEKFCAKTCKDDTCDQTSGECADCSSTPVGPLCRDIDAQATASVAVEEKLSMGAIIGISAGCAGAVVIIVILMVCCVFYRRQATDAKNEIHLPSDVLERLSTHRSHHSTISSQYPVARVVGDDEKDFVLF